jgi:hypothetical protein
MGMMLLEEGIYVAVSQAFVDTLRALMITRFNGQRKADTIITQLMTIYRNCFIGTDFNSAQCSASCQHCLQACPPKPKT